MKELNVTFTDGEFKKMIKVKDITEKSWHDFILYLVEISAEKNERGKE